MFGGRFQWTFRGSGKVGWLILALLCLSSPIFSQSTTPTEPSSPAGKVSPTPATRAPRKRSEPVFIEAETLQKKGNLTIATGNVTVELEGMRLDCQRLVYDPAKGLITATGECLFSWGENFAASQTITLDVNTEHAVLTGVAGKGEG